MFYLMPCTDPVSMDLAHNALLLGAVASLKPDAVLELGVGAGYTSGAILQALAWNQKGRLTIVDNWHDWRGREPPHAQQLREAGARIVIRDEESFVKRCKANTYDVLVSDADHSRSHLWLDQHLRIVRPGGLMFFHDTANPAFPNLARILEGVQERKLWHYHFTASSRPDERCHRGLLMVQNQKTIEAIGTGSGRKVRGKSAQARKVRSNLS
jgi:predicted O-methyltransferase YrrM